MAQGQVNLYLIIFNHRCLYSLGRTVQGVKLGVASSFSKAQPIPNYNGFGTE